MQVKVQFDDEDGVVSHWIDVLGSSSTGIQAYSMPGMKDEVWCALDAKGESGCVLGSRYNAKDPAPHANNGMVAIEFPGGYFRLDTASGACDVKFSGAGTIEAGGDLNLKTAGKLYHNGKNIGSDHKHTDVVFGSQLSGGPV